MFQDLLRYDAPLSGPKISRMLNQLNFKLQVEGQYLQGIQKMAQLYRDEGDRKLKNETESKKRESENRILLLKRALKRYETLRQFETGEEDEGEFEFLSKSSQEKRKLIRLALIRVPSWRSAQGKPPQTFSWSTRHFPQDGSRPQPRAALSTIVQSLQRDHGGHQD